MTVVLKLATHTKNVDLPSAVHLHLKKLPPLRCPKHNNAYMSQTVWQGDCMGASGW
jgi:hypothetical protein